MFVIMFDDVPKIKKYKRTMKSLFLELDPSLEETPEVWTPVMDLITVDQKMNGAFWLTKTDFAHQPKVKK